MLLGYTHLNQVWYYCKVIVQVSAEVLLGRHETTHCTFNFDSASQLSLNDIHILRALNGFVSPDKGRCPEAKLRTPRLHLVSA